MSPLHIVALLVFSLGVSQRIFSTEIVTTDREAAGQRTLPVTVSGRVQEETEAGSTVYRSGWPGVYFETRFQGTRVGFRVGPGDPSLHVLVDGSTIQSLSHARQAHYEIKGLSPGAHTARIEFYNSGPANSLEFGGYYAPQETKSLRATSRSMQMEFIGDSHNVGYANRSTKTQCTQDEILDSTDSSLAPGPLVAKHFKADYQINALSGRGVVRNFDGFGGATLPQAYPYAVFGSERPYVDRSWRPQFIAISLGTNDFAMPLHANEPWQGDDALRSDYVASYVRFVKDLRARSNTALIVIWAIDWKRVPASVPAGQQVVAQLNAEGDERVGFLEISNLSMGACNFHPTAEDDRTIADSLIAYIESHQRPVSTSP